LIYSDLPASTAAVLMTAVEVTPLPSKPFVAMEDRKRPSSYENDSMPPLKKQASAVNGSSKNADNEMPWDKDLEVRQTIHEARDLR
jgi:hypothetical protein